MRNSLDILRLTSGHRGYSPASHGDLIRIEAPAEQLETLAREIGATRGIHRVEVRWNGGHTVKADDGSYSHVDSNWRRIIIWGTDRAVRGASNRLMLSGLIEADKNADHDHERCIRNARAQGVPAWSAHNIERYLSQ